MRWQDTLKRYGSSVRARWGCIGAVVSQWRPKQERKGQLSLDDFKAAAKLAPDVKIEWDKFNGSTEIKIAAIKEAFAGSKLTVEQLAKVLEQLKSGAPAGGEAKDGGGSEEKGAADSKQSEEAANKGEASESKGGEEGKGESKAAAEGGDSKDSKESSGDAGDEAKAAGGADGKVTGAADGEGGDAVAAGGTEDGSDSADQKVKGGAAGGDAAPSAAATGETAKGTSADEGKGDGEKEPDDQMSPLQALSNERIRPMTDAFAKLRQILDKDHAAPKVLNIVVGGERSSGKTSVVEAITGISLPCGEGGVTSIPVTVRLCQLREDENEEYAVLRKGQISNFETKHFSGLRDGTSAGETGERSRKKRRAFPPTRVQEEVAQAMADIISTNKDYSGLCLEVLVYRRQQVEMVITDLPGTSSGASNDGGGDREMSIANLYISYMQPSDTLIVNVLSAITDFTASNTAMKLSGQVDPNRDRTMLVVSKLDDVRDVARITRRMYSFGLDGKRPFGLKEGMLFAARTRTTAETANGVSLARSRRIEADFFNQFMDLPSTMLGVGNLSKRIIAIEQNRILSELPAMRVLIERRMRSLEQERRDLGSTPNSQGECLSLYQTSLNRMFSLLEAQWTGRVDLAQILGFGSASRAKRAETIDDEDDEIFWEIKDFRALVARCKAGVEVRGPVCKINGLNWRFTMYPNGELGAKKGYLSLYYELVELPEDLHSVKVQIKVFTPVKTLNDKTTDEFSPADMCWGWQDGLERKRMPNHFVLRGVLSKMEKVRKDGDRENESKRALKTPRNRRASGLSEARAAGDAEAEDKPDEGPNDIADQKYRISIMVKNRDKQFVDEIRNLISNRYFFTPGFKSFIQREVQHRAGGLMGHESQLMRPEVAIYVTHTLMTKLKLPLHGYVTSIASYMEWVLLRLTSLSFKQFPKLARAMQKVIRTRIEEVTRDVRKQVSRILKWEEQLYTNDPSFNALRREIEAELLGEEPGAALSSAAQTPRSLKPLALPPAPSRRLTPLAALKPAGGSDGKEDPLASPQGSKAHLMFLEGLSSKTQFYRGYDRELLLLQIKLYAYWQTILRRMSDYVPMCVRNTLVIELIQEDLKPRLHEEIVKQNLVQLMEPTTQVLQKRASIELSNTNLQMAWKLVQKIKDIAYGTME